MIVKIAHINLFLILNFIFLFFETIRFINLIWSRATI